MVCREDNMSVGMVCREDNISVLGCDFEALFSFFKNKKTKKLIFFCFCFFNLDVDMAF